MKTGVFDLNDCSSIMRGFSNRAGKYVLNDSKPTFFGQKEFYTMRDTNEAAKPNILRILPTRISIIKEVLILLDEIISAVETKNAGLTKPCSFLNQNYHFYLYFCVCLFLSMENERKVLIAITMQLFSSKYCFMVQYH